MPRQRPPASVNGAGLILCPTKSASVAWIRNPDGFKPRDFKHYAQIRINALPTRKRVNRVKDGLVLCRGCFAPSETLAHIAQDCPRTHEMRLARHEDVVKRLAGSLREKGYEVELEHLFKLHGKNLKPDIVAIKADGTRGRVSIICDVQVVSEVGSRAAHMSKVVKYDHREDLKAAILAKHRSTEVLTVAASLTWTGVWVQESAHSLRALGLSGGILNALVLRVLHGTLLTWRTRLTQRL